MVLRQERKGMEKKFFELCTQVVKDENLELYDLEYLPGSHELRLYIQNPETGTAVLEDCIRVDRAMTPHIDDSDWMPEELTLEVSSPGLYRQLNTLMHFETVVGEKIKLIAMKKLEVLFSGTDDVELPRKVKSGKTLIAKLLKVTPEELELELDEKKLNMKFDWIKKANLETELDNF